ncbi:unnamed protein product [Cylicostephanus goldi]|uniref:Uncharacterized protein n=1 Tax=Cylicostephanus goldi TaxID=71465 RepID=A0A3P7MK02_CYLGO|nr:unnamed protein product [Cylicostephanus goldi]
MNRSASAYTGGRRPFGYRGRGSPARRGNLQMGTNRGGLQNGRGIFTKRSVEQVVNRTMSNVVSEFDRLVGRKRTEIQTAGVEEPDGEHLSNILITLLLSVSAVTLLIIMKLVPPSICVCHALFFGASIISLLISAEGSSLSIVTLKSFKIMFYLQEGKLFLRYDDILVKMLQQEAEYFGLKSLARRLRNLEAQPGDELCMIAANERTASF